MRSLAGALAAAAVTVAALSCGRGAVAADRGRKIDLRLNLKPGDQRKSTADIDLNVYVSDQGQTQKTNVAIGVVTDFKVLDVDSDGVHTIQSTCDRVRMKMSRGPLSIEYDSAKPADDSNPLTQVFAPMIGTKETIKVTPKGERLKAKGVDKSTEKTGRNLPKAARDNLEEQTKGMTGVFDQTIAFLPGKPVAVGDSWKGSRNVATGPNAPMTIDAKYTLKGRKNGKAIVKTDYTVKSPAGLSGTMKGTMTIDEKTGWEEGSQMTVDLNRNAQGAQVQIDGKVKFGS